MSIFTVLMWLAIFGLSMLFALRTGENWINIQTERSQKKNQKFALLSLSSSYFGFMFFHYFIIYHVCKDMGILTMLPWIKPSFSWLVGFGIVVGVISTIMAGDCDASTEEDGATMFLRSWTKEDKESFYQYLHWRGAAGWIFDLIPTSVTSDILFLVIFLSAYAIFLLFPPFAAFGMMFFYFRRGLRRDASEKLGIRFV